MLCSHLACATMLSYSGEDRAIRSFASCCLVLFEVAARVLTNKANELSKGGGYGCWARAKTSCHQRLENPRTHELDKKYNWIFLTICCINKSFASLVYFVSQGSPTVHGCTLECQVQRAVRAAWCDPGPFLPFQFELRFSRVWFILFHKDHQQYSNGVAYFCIGCILKYQV